MICLARGNFCNEKPAASLATAHKCLKKKTPCRFIGDTRPPCQCQRLITSAAQKKKNAKMPLGFSRLCAEACLLRALWRVSTSAQTTQLFVPKGAMGSHRWAMVCDSLRLNSHQHYKDVSENLVPPNSPNHPILIGFSIINHPFWVTPVFGNHHKGSNLFFFGFFFC